MIRRLVIAVSALLGVAALTSCATFTDNDVAASVNGVELTRDTLEQYIQDVLVATRPDDVPETLDGETIRGVIGGWIVDELIRQQLAEQDVSITEEDRTAAADQFEASLAGLEVSELVRTFEIDRLSTRAAFERTQDAGSLTDIEARADIEVDPRYGAWSSETGTVVALG